MGPAAAPHTAPQEDRADTDNDVAAITQLVNSYWLAVDSQQQKHLFESIFTPRSTPTTCQDRPRQTTLVHLFDQWRILPNAGRCIAYSATYS